MWYLQIDFEVFQFSILPSDCPVKEGSSHSRSDCVVHAVGRNEKGLHQGMTGPAAKGQSCTRLTEDHENSPGYCKLSVAF